MNHNPPPQNKKFYRSDDERIFAGVAGGLGEYFDVNPWLIRIGLVLGSGTAVIPLLYFAAAILVPTSSTAHPQNTAAQSFKRLGLFKQICLVLIAAFLAGQAFGTWLVSSILIVGGLWVLSEHRKPAGFSQPQPGYRPRGGNTPGFDQRGFPTPPNTAQPYMAPPFPTADKTHQTAGSANTTAGHQDSKKLTLDEYAEMVNDPNQPDPYDLYIDEQNRAEFETWQAQRKAGFDGSPGQGAGYGHGEEAGYGYGRSRGKRPRSRAKTAVLGTFLGVFLIACIAIPAALFIPFANDGFGNNFYRPIEPLTQSGLQYKLGAGELTVDLTRMPISSSADLPVIDISLGAGDLTIIVPEHLAGTYELEAEFGSVTSTVDGSIFNNEGRNAHLKNALPGSGQQVKIKAKVRFGEITIKTA